MAHAAAMARGAALQLRRYGPHVLSTLDARLY